MNLLIVILIVGLSCECSLGNPTLRHELKDIYDYIPHAKIYEITREYWENDVSMKVAVDYLKTEEFGSAWNKFFFSPEVSDILYWTQKNDVDVSRMFKYIAKRINQMNPMEEHSELVIRNPKSLLSFGIEIRKLIDWNVLQSAVAEKVEDGNDFAQLFMILKASKPALEKTFADDAIVTALVHLKDLGVDVDSIQSFIYSLLYWQ